MNRILPKEPDRTPATFVFGLTRRFVIGFRTLLVLIGVVAVVVCAPHWSAMPTFARLLVAIVVPSLISIAVSPRPWRHTTRFIANETGMYFPAYPPMMLFTSEPEAEVNWLEVPWKHIANIRVATEAGEDGSCVAFDIQTSPSEKSRFFEAVGIPRDRNEQLPATVFAAYGGWPPSPVRAVEKLRFVAAQHVGRAS